MKSTRKMAVIISLCITLCIPLSADEKTSNLEVGAFWYTNDVLLANDEFYQQFNPYLSYTRDLKTGDGIGWKLNAYADAYMQFKSGTYDGTYQMKPQVEFYLGDLSATLAVPCFYMDVDALNAGKGCNYWATNRFKEIDSTSDLFIDLWGKLGYKLSVTDIFKINLGIEADGMVVPVTAFADVKPCFAINLGPLCLSNKLSIYFLPEVDKVRDTQVYFFLDETLSFDFGIIGAKGLKMSVSPSIPLTDDLKGISINPLICYKIGGLYLEMSFKMSNIDKEKAVDNCDPTFNPYLKCAYTFAF